MVRKETYWKNPEKYRRLSNEYHKEHRDKARIIQRRFTINHPEYYKEKTKEYRKNHRERINRSIREYKKQNKKTVNAQNHAKKYTILGKNCELCGTEDNLQRHHPDYDEPLIIVTVCNHCHGWIHKGVD